MVLSNTWKFTLPASGPPAGALTVALSFGMNDCAEVIDDATELTTTVSLVSEQSLLNVEVRLFGSPVAGV